MKWTEPAHGARTRATSFVVFAALSLACGSSRSDEAAHAPSAATDDGVAPGQQPTPHDRGLSLTGAPLDPNLLELRAADGLVLVTFATRRLLCPRQEGDCLSFPREGVVHDFVGDVEEASLTIAHDDGWIEQWSVLGATQIAHRRARWREAERWTTGPAVVSRQAVYEGRSLSPAPRPAVLATRAEQRACDPEIASIRAESATLTIAQCAAGPERAATIRATVDGHAFHTSSVLGSEELMRIVEARSEFVAWIARDDDGEGPGGHTVERLRIAGEGVTASFEVGQIATDGLGAGPEGYVVSVAKRRLRFALRVPTGASFPDALRIEGCEGWVGEHHRRSDRWSGRACTQTLDLTLPVSAERGVVVNDEARNVLDACCALPR
jgi:hypothetical protein